MRTQPDRTGEALTFLRGISLFSTLDEKETGYIAISQDELAHRTGLIRQTVAKVLGKWRQRGYLLTGRGRIVLRNPKMLKEMAEQIIV